MRILGVDPGLNRTGYGLIEAHGRGDMKLVKAGVIKTLPGDGISGRVVKIYNGLNSVLEQYRPEILVLEKLYSHYKHPVTSILMGHARGIVCLSCGMSGARLINYSATRIKKALTGNGRAGKRQLQMMVKNILGIDDQPESFDVTDALAMALSYVYIEGT